MGMVQEWYAVAVEEVPALLAMDGDALVDWLEQDPPPGPVLDLDKQWHALHAILTDSAWDTDRPGWPTASPAPSRRLA